MLSVKIQKRMTINTGNYSSIQPAIEVELTDIKPEEFNKKVESLNTIADSLFTTQLIEHTELQQIIKDNGVHVVIKSINIDGMKEDLKEALQQLE